MSAVPDITSVEMLDKRQFQRVPLEAYGRYMLPDRSEHECRVVEMSPGDAIVQGPVSAPPGSRIIMYIDSIGRIEGQIVRDHDRGFSVAYNLHDRKRERVAAKLTWLANRHELNLPEDRRHERVVPRNTHSVLRLADGREYTCKIIDLSLSGAALEIAVRPAKGTLVTLGAMRARVVRHFDEGVAIEFAFVQNEETLDQFINNKSR